MADTYSYKLRTGETVQVANDSSGKTGTGSTVWDTCLVLTKLLERVASQLPDHIDDRDASATPKLQNLFQAKRIVEVGAGTGLLSLVLAKLYQARNLDAEFVVTDGRTLDALRQNIQTNFPTQSRVTVKAGQLMWGNAEQADAAAPPFDLILCSDCLSWPELYDFLIETLDRLSQYSDNPTMLLFGFERRNFDEEAAFFAHLGGAQGKWRFRDIKQSEQDEEYSSDDIFTFVGSRKR